MTNYELEQSSFRKRVVRVIIFGIIGILALAASLMILLPKYNVYQQRKAGEAALAHARSSKEVAVQEAKAKKESAVYLAEADTIRARGVALSNQIIGASLKDNEAYLKWLWIDQLEKNPQAVIYVPTENSFPIMEATRLSKPKEQNVQ